MNTGQYEKFMSDAKIEREGVKTGLFPANVNIVVRVVGANEEEEERRELFLENGECLRLSPRATKNVLRLTGFSNRLFKELEVAELQTGINTQLARFDSLGMSVSEKEVICVFNGKKTYVPYESFLPSASELCYIKGNPIESDVIVFQTDEGNVKVGDESIILGMNVSVSSTGYTGTNVSCGTFREVCENGVSYPWFFNYKLPRFDTKLLGGILGEFKENKSKILDELAGFIRGLEDYAIHNVEELHTVMEPLSLQRKLKEEIFMGYQRPEETRELFKKSGVDRISNLWDLFNVLTYQTNQLGGLRSFKWATLRVANWGRSLQLANKN